MDIPTALCFGLLCLQPTPSIKPFNDRPIIAEPPSRDFYVIEPRRGRMTEILCPDPNFCWSFPYSGDNP